MKTILPFLFCLITFTINAQEVFEIEEDKPKTMNGIEFSYTIRNERTEDTYSRYEVTVMAQNKSGCQLIYLKNANDDFYSLFEGDPAAIARFECMNATGKRLTSKGANVKARQFFVPYKLSEKGSDGKTVTRNIQVEAGFMLKNGARVTNDLIVIVPKGEKPKFKVRTQRFSDLAGE